MRRLSITVLLMLAMGGAWAQPPLKLRPDAFPPVKEETIGTKSIDMAYTIDEMASWDRYPTYQTYVALMQQWVADYPDICTLDTIGLSVEGRLILALHIEGSVAGTSCDDTDSSGARSPNPEFFYSSSIHGDELTGYIMMLRLIDTLLSSYGVSERLTDLVNTTAIYINPLANPDGAYHRHDYTVQGSTRENANGLDLNRCYPDPFYTSEGRDDSLLIPENWVMIDYFTAHHFRLSANLHGGSEVMNYPWDSFTFQQEPHPQAAWWEEVCHRFVDTSRTYAPNHFNDVVPSGVTPGGNWYIIHGGRQDYVNYYHNCLELTMEISSRKLIDCQELPGYWRILAPSLINYIFEIHSLPGMGGEEGIDEVSAARTVNVYPNPATDRVTVEGCDTRLSLFDIYGREVATGRGSLDIRALPQGVYLLRVGGAYVKVIKN